MKLLTSDYFYKRKSTAVALLIALILLLATVSAASASTIYINNSTANFSNSSTGISWNKTVNSSETFGYLNLTGSSPGYKTLTDQIDLSAFPGRIYVNVSKNYSIKVNCSTAALVLPETYCYIRGNGTLNLTNDNGPALKGFHINATDTNVSLYSGKNYAVYIPNSSAGFFNITHSDVYGKGNNNYGFSNTANVFYDRSYLETNLGSSSERFYFKNDINVSGDFENEFIYVGAADKKNYDAYRLADISGENLTFSQTGLPPGAKIDARFDGSTKYLVIKNLSHPGIYNTKITIKSTNVSNSSNYTTKTINATIDASIQLSSDVKDFTSNEAGTATNGTYWNSSNKTLTLNGSPNLTYTYNGKYSNYKNSTRGANEYHGGISTYLTTTTIKIPDRFVYVYDDNSYQALFSYNDLVITGNGQGSGRLVVYGDIMAKHNLTFKNVSVLVDNGTISANKITFDNSTVIVRNSKGQRTIVCDRYNITYANSNTTYIVNETDLFIITAKNVPVPYINETNSSITRMEAGTAVNVTLNGRDIDIWDNWSALPPGITLNKTSGRLTGKPTTPGYYPVKISGYNNKSRASYYRWVNITVSPTMTFDNSTPSYDMTKSPSYGRANHTWNASTKTLTIYGGSGYGAVRCDDMVFRNITAKINVYNGSVTLIGKNPICVYNGNLTITGNGTLFAVSNGSTDSGYSSKAPSNPPIIVNGTSNWLKFENANVFLCSNNSNPTVNAHNIYVNNSHIETHLYNSTKPSWLSTPVFNRSYFASGNASSSNTSVASEPLLKGISVATKPTKTSYLVGESFNSSGMRVNATWAFDNGNTFVSNETANVTWTPEKFTTSGTQNVTFRLNTPGNQTATTNLSVTVTAGTKPNITTTSLPLAHARGDMKNYTANLSATGTTPMTWELGDGTGMTPVMYAWPKWLSINKTTGVLSGTVQSWNRHVTTQYVMIAQNNTYQFYVTAKNAVGSSTKKLNLTVYPAVYLSECHFDVNNNPRKELGNAFNSPVINVPDVWVDDNVSVGFVMGYNTSTKPNWTVVDGTLPPGLNMNVLGGIRGKPTKVGNYSFVVRLSNSEGYWDTLINMNVTGIAPIIEYSKLPSGTVNETYSSTFKALGTKPITWTLANGTKLPAGLTLNKTTGAISGKPTESGYFEFNVTATNDVGSDTKTFYLAIAVDPKNVPAITTESLPDATVNTAYKQTFTASGPGPMEWYSIKNDPDALENDTGLPSGMTLDKTTGALSGTPKTSGSYNFLVIVKNKYSADIKEFTLNVNEKTGTAPVITTTTVANGTVNVSYSQKFNATGTAPITWMVVKPTPTALIEDTGALPPGLTLNKTSGILSGKPTKEGTYEFTIVAKNDFGFSKYVTYKTTITKETTGTPEITTATVANGKMFTYYEQKLDATGTAPITWSLTGAKLPDGLTLDAEKGIISGIPIKAGNYSFSIVASNSKGNDTAKYTITVTAKKQRPKPTDADKKRLDDTIGKLVNRKASEIDKTVYDMNKDGIVDGRDMILFSMEINTEE